MVTIKSTTVFVLIDAGHTFTVCPKFWSAYDGLVYVLINVVSTWNVTIYKNTQIH